MNALPDWSTPARPVEITHERIVQAILTGGFPANSHLPAERQLAERLGVTRSTLREALQRLAAGGWIDIQQGKATRVRDIWTEGNLSILAALVDHQQFLPASFIPHLLQVRTALAPVYTAEAIVQNGVELADFLMTMLDELADTPEAFAEADWALHHRLTVLSTNPVYTLILNGFEGFYQQMALIYFAHGEARALSRRFYADLNAAARNGQAENAREITSEMMRQSIDLWQSGIAGS
jgi:GntR family transcriptional regulator, negative regulator for fad regulon and positive regulator of fabA